MNNHMLLDIATTNSRSKDTRRSVSLPDTGLLCDLNPFRFKNVLGNYLQWQVYNTHAELFVKQMHKPRDMSFVRAFPRFIRGTAFGRYESYLLHQLRKLPGTRGQGGMTSPVFDMDQLRELCGWPCQIRDMGDVWIYCDFDIDDSLDASVFVDSYANAWQGNHNDSIQPNASKSLNVNIHLGRPKRDNSGAPGGGWSGGKVIAEVEMFGIRWWVVYKRETAGTGNNFDYLSFLPISGKSTMINLRVMYEWAFNNDLAKLAKAVGLEARAFYTDKDTVGGPHIGSEIWHGEGRVLYKYLRVVDHHGDAGFGKIPDTVQDPATWPIKDIDPVVVDDSDKHDDKPRDPLFDDVPGDKPAVVGDGTGHTLPVINDNSDNQGEDIVDAAGAPVRDRGGSAIEIDHAHKHATVYVPAHIMTENYEITIAPMWRKPKG